MINLEMTLNEDELLIDMEDYQYADELFHIESIHCDDCSERHNFYLKQGVSRCENCHSIVTATKTDFDSVANRCPRAGILRFKGIYDLKTRLSHFEFMKKNGLPVTHSS